MQPQGSGCRREAAGYGGNAALQALVADYVEQAERHGVIPMYVPLGRYLAHIED